MELIEALFVAYAVVWGIGAGLFTLRSSHEPVRSRNKLLVCLQSLSSIGFFAAIAFAIPRYPCEASFFVFPMAVPLLSMPYVYRSFELWYHYKVNRKAAQVNKPDEEDNLFAQAFPSPINLFPKHWAINNRWLSGLVFQLSLFFLYALAYLTVLLPIFFASRSSIVPRAGCLLVPQVLVAIQTGLLLVLAGVFGWLLLKVKDSYLIRLELGLVAPPGLALMVAASALYFVPLSALPPWVRGEYAVLCFCALSTLVSLYFPALMTFERLVLLLRGAADHLPSHSPEGAGKEDLFFYCLQDKKLCKSFEQFCVESFAAENLFFYKHAVNYRLLKGEFLKTEAFRMRHEYITPESVFEVELNPNTKDRILKRIESGEIDDTLFLEAEQEIYLNMRQAIFPLWKRSDLFKEATRGGLRRNRSFFRKSDGSSQFVTPVDQNTYELEKARRRSVEIPEDFTLPTSLSPPPPKQPMGAETVRRTIDGLTWPQEQELMEQLRQFEEEKSTSAQENPKETPAAPQPPTEEEKGQAPAAEKEDDEGEEISALASHNLDRDSYHGNRDSSTNLLGQQ